MNIFHSSGMVRLVHSSRAVGKIERPKAWTTIFVDYKRILATQPWGPGVEILRNMRYIMMNA